MKQFLIFNIRRVKDYMLELSFDDNCVKQYHISHLIKYKGAAEPFQDKVLCERFSNRMERY
jgi:hypothetical protein